MALLRKRPVPKEQCNPEPIRADREWLDKFHALLDDSAWNQCSNGWLNKQYAAGKTPEQVIAQCHTHGL